MPDSPVTQTIHFDPSGGPLTVQLLAVPASPGHYSVMLFEHDRFTLVKDFGNNAFSTPAANTHKLPQPPGANDGRLLLVQTSIGVVDPSGTAVPIVTVFQDGNPLGSASDTSDASGTTKESELVVNLTGQAVVTASAAKVIADGKAGSKSHAKSLSRRIDELQDATEEALDSEKKSGAGKQKGGSQ